MKRDMVIVTSLLAVVVVMWINTGVLSGSKTIEADRIVLRDSLGIIRAELRVLEAEDVKVGAGLYLYDRSGKLRARLTTDSEGTPELVLSDAKEQVRASVSLGSFDGGTVFLSGNLSGVRLLDESGEMRSKLLLGKTGLPTLEMCDSNGQPRIAFGVDNEGNAIRK